MTGTQSELDAALCRLQRLSDDFFGVSPDDVNWGHVTELADYCWALKQITEQALREGDYATWHRRPLSCPLVRFKMFSF